MDKISKDKYKEKCILLEESKNFSNKLESELEIEITDFLIRNSGKFVVIKVLDNTIRSAIYRLLNTKSPYLNFKNNNLIYLGKIDYFENCSKEDVSGTPDTIGFIDKEKTLILTTGYEDDLEYGMYIHSTQIYGNGELISDRALFRINFTHPDILDNFIFFDTEEDAKLYLEVSD